MNGGFLFRTAIVNVAMDVAVLLSLQFLLGGNGKTALAASQEAAIRLRIILGRSLVAPELRYFLHAVEQFFAHDGRMRALVHFAAVGELSKVKRIGEQKGYLTFLERPAAAFVPSARCSCLDAALKKKLRNIFEPRFVLGVQLECFAHKRRFAAIHDDSLGVWVVEVAQRCDTRIDTLPCLLPEATRHIHTQIADVLIRHAELDGHEKYIVMRQIRLVVRNDFLNDTLLQKPTDATTVHGIARESINFPTHDALRIATLDTFQHILKDGTAGHFRAPLLHKFLCNF